VTGFSLPSSISAEVVLLQLLSIARIPDVTQVSRVRFWKLGGGAAIHSQPRRSHCLCHMWQQVKSTAAPAQHTAPDAQLAPALAS
jgi:hypothetical protein